MVQHQRILGKLLVVLSAVLFTFAQDGMAQSDSLSNAGKKVIKRSSNKPLKRRRVIKKRKSERLDVKDIEKKYWSAKDKDFSIVQNRAYKKAKRFAITGMYGSLLNDSYIESKNWTAGLQYFLSERYGLEAFYTSGSPKDGELLSEFDNIPGNTGVRPNYNHIDGYYGLSFIWVPFYAKMSFLGKKILYFDMSFSPNIGMASYSQITQGALIAGGGNNYEADIKTSESSFAFGLDVTQQIFFTNHFAARIDLKNKWYKRKTVGYRTSGSIVKGDIIDDKLVNDSLLQIGLTFFF